MATKIGILTIEIEENGLNKTSIINLDNKDLNIIKSLILNREKDVMLSNPMNVKEAQKNDKVLSRMEKLEWWNW